MLKLAFKFSSGLLLFLLLFVKTTTLYCGNLDVLEHLIGDRDAVLVADPKGHIVFSKNVDIQLIPASTLKIFTALVAIHYLGPDYKFFTEFYMDRHSNLKIKGYGDPLLISETVAEMIHHLSMGLSGKYSIINDLILDDSYFG
ncbi:MAG: D-alanyl-D-alanine carboxypeptidase, partial [Desulfobacteraceae bacterium]|nr:D-alanyl-D-alanine carboxypeptidase [Desulfobacteraceae bacterium]